jgi:hypothetical protein
MERVIATTAQMIFFIVPPIFYVGSNARTPADNNTSEICWRCACCEQSLSDAVRSIDAALAPLTDPKTYVRSDNGAK